MAQGKPRETDLYPPVKAFLEGQGYEVKSEIGAVDVMACRADDEPVIVELKTGFALSLFHQAIARQLVADAVYIAVPRGKGRSFAKALKDNKTLARRLGLGLITVRLADTLVEVHCDPGPFAPRKSKPRRTRLLREFARREGDPNQGGATRVGLVTAYRQDALRCARHLADHGPSKGAVVAKATGVSSATRLMAADHYGWFERVSKGIYALTPKGVNSLTQYADLALSAPIMCSEISPPET
ncbi:DUF2161 domain-containing phosphodiesterase [Actibacterium sp. 188UL27-1]|uniref:DUF2161 domain-containing phosphodiesterase n=1 Tax=Actibacterium sp. 188UL27-1 TaxID=2786961 RepID=UPI0019590773|nr:DUF2161 family putative PD-(D/E)XK-type phosphodiesterase [Actibacterium sp. 188UL27-1]MBM7066332.1 hypothetical protein [Actibacterium sp. 188UL27-1]